MSQTGVAVRGRLPDGQLVLEPGKAGTLRRIAVRRRLRALVLFDEVYGFLPPARDRRELERNGPKRWA